MKSKPYDIILKIDSIVKHVVRTISAYFKNDTRSLFGSFNGLSSASKILEIAINAIIRPSKYLLLTIMVMKILNLFSLPKNTNEFPSQWIKLLKPVSSGLLIFMVFEYMITAKFCLYDAFNDFEGEILTEFSAISGS